MCGWCIRIHPRTYVCMYAQVCGVYEYKPNAVRLDAKSRPWAGYPMIFSAAAVGWFLLVVDVDFADVVAAKSFANEFSATRSTLVPILMCGYFWPN